MTEVLHVGAFSACVCQPDKHAMNYYVVSFRKGDRSDVEPFFNFHSAALTASEYAVKGYVADVYGNGELIFNLQPATEAELVLARVL